MTIRDRRLTDLLSVPECGWLDVKGGIYQLDDPAKVEELVKDVAGFANSRAGGLLLVGFSTRKEHDREIIDQVRPVPRALVDLDRHRKLIRERVIPPPRGVTVDWIDCGNDTGVLVIDVPAQPSACLPYVVLGPARAAAAGSVSVAVPIREADATPWLPQAEIQRLLAAGWTATGGPSEEFLAGLIEKAVTAARREPSPSRPAFRIGEGAPGWTGPFQQAWTELTNAGTWIGEPASAVYSYGPGVVQHFESSLTASGWVLCALPHRRPVAVAGEVWQALQRAGSGAIGGDALGAIGFPTPDPDVTRAIGASDVGVDLTGGEWGDGRLVRSTDKQEWCWDPAVVFGMNMTRSAGYWTADHARQLRLRAVATLPWAVTGDLAITAQRRANLEQALPFSELADAVTILSRRRGADLRAAAWNRVPNRNALDALSYSALLAAPDGQPALSAEVMMALPNTMSSAVASCAELRLLDLAAWANALARADAPAQQDLRLSVQEVAEFLTSAWQTATENLPAVVTTEVQGMLWAYPPTVELRLTAEHDPSAASGQQPMLDDYIDLSPLGVTDRGQVPVMAVTITAPPVLSAPDRRAHTAEALAYMAQQFGFLNATPGCF
jgi:hypothetical protein